MDDLQARVFGNCFPTLCCSDFVNSSRRGRRSIIFVPASTVKMKIRLTTPIQDKDQDPAVDLNPATLENTLKQFRSADMVETVRKLDQALTAFNEVSTPAANRLKLLEIYHSAFQKLLQGFDEMRIAQLKVPANKKQQLSNDIMWLHIKLSHGYKIIIKDYSGRRGQQDQPSYLTLATFRALEQTVVSLIYSYRFGLDVPPLTYLELHQLYAFAEYYGLLNKPIRGANGYAKTPTIASCYTLALFFISIEPRQYEPYTLEVLFLALQPFSFKCTIKRSLKLSADSYIYKINLNDNKPPSIIVSNETIDESKCIRYLNIDNFIAEIAAWLEQNKDNQNTLLIEQELELFPAILTRLKINLNDKKPHLAEYNPELREKEYKKLVVGLAPLESLLIMQSVDLNLKLNYKHSTWAVLTESSAGCELSSNIENFEEELSLGDLVSIVSGDSGDESIDLVKIAHICSLQQLETGALLLGLEYLSGRAYPLTYVMMSDEGEICHTAASIGLYLMDETGSGEEPMMVVNKKHYNQSRQYMIKTTEKVCTVEATRFIRRSPKYCYFHYTILQEECSKFVGAQTIINLAV